MFIFEGNYTRAVVQFENASDVEDFCRISNKYDMDIDAISPDRHYVLDAKSLLGMHSLELDKPVIVHTLSTGVLVREYFKEISKYIALDDVSEAILTKASGSID